MKTPKFANNQPWRVWLFVIGLNILAFIGVFFLKLKGIDLYAFRGGS
ncbi:MULTISPECIES: hypothetical protein [Prochlorococcus]|uniref:Uncharacterized protein n=1 Tax=Prochlorococcus marinus (strain SARG / CCMP1375 / SS120) TaxID=167539 RepID=Q7VCN5_PROMA|nr:MULTISPECIES: hypothetical protein [Prochlorococcus]AAP99749.1 Predicted protein [Prochlorococcus marinus subsp. marinus str. CCMP1375]KGG14458.1 hypothetical protein EV04_0035 [Prochlorococcus marinus str. LG]KGG22552.1 hypothetical protein EV08_0067 [Prochlorococcus marinus str. SS2]KGG24395.1 hypothetical protein EV09_0302 [Prochlorococcus marinus str. SS35]KGG34167.1 hypothetical protein EV10_0013 [Prochlorococcus marinus str. SS51]